MQREIGLPPACKPSFIMQAACAEEEWPKSASPANRQMRFSRHMKRPFTKRECRAFHAMQGSHTPGGRSQRAADREEEAGERAAREE